MSNQRDSLLRLIAIVVGIGMVVAAFFLVILFGRSQQAPTFRVAVVRVDDIAVGDTLRSEQVLFEPFAINPGLANLYVTEEEFQNYVGRQVITPLRYGQPVQKSALLSSGSRNRYASFLDNPDQVVMYVPVADMVFPPIAPGDRIDIWMVLGSAQGYDNLLDPTPTPTPFLPENLLGTLLPPLPDVTATVPPPLPEDVALTPEVDVTLTPTPTATAIVRFPIADLIAQGILVIDTDVRPPANERERPRLVGLLAVVPRQVSTRLLFALNSGARIVIAISAPFESNETNLSPFPVPYDYEQFRLDTRAKIEQAARLGFFGPYQNGLWDAYLQAFMPDVYLNIQATRQAALQEINRDGLPRPYALPTNTPAATSQPNAGERR